MGTIFVDSLYRTIDDKSEGRARLFIAITGVAAEFYGVPMPLSEVVNDECHINQEQFCLLVEKVFAHPVDLFYVWARHAAGMYDAITGELHIWRWSNRESPLTLFQPQHHSSSVPTKIGRKVIGSQS